MDQFKTYSVCRATDISGNDIKMGKFRIENQTETGCIVNVWNCLKLYIKCINIYE